MAHLLPYLCPFADCNLQNKMWGVRLEWETHLNDQHPIPHAQGGETERYAFTCNICPRTFHSDDHSLREESNNPFCVFRNSHYADHMERIALSIEKDYESGSPAKPRMLDAKRGFKPLFGHENPVRFAISLDSSTSEHDEEGLSGRRGRLKHGAGLASPHDSLSPKPTRVCITEMPRRRRRHRSRVANPHDFSSSEGENKTTSGRRWRPKHRAGVASPPNSSSSSDKEAISGWSSECSNHSRARSRDASPDYDPAPSGFVSHTARRAHSRATKKAQKRGEPLPASRPLSNNFITKYNDDTISGEELREIF